MESVVLLHNIRSVHNVGSIFRTADAAGVSAIVLSGYSPLPVDRFKQPRKDFTKVSLGAERTVPWSYSKNISTVIRKLKNEGFTIVALEQDTNSVPLFTYTPTPDMKLALVVGNEVRGVSPQTRKLCDVIVEIPMHGSKESLNVSVAAGIALFVLTNSAHNPNRI